MHTCLHGPASVSKLCPTLLASLGLWGVSLGNTVSSWRTALGKKLTQPWKDIPGPQVHGLADWVRTVRMHISLALLIPPHGKDTDAGFVATLVLIEPTLPKCQWTSGQKGSLGR